ncbi:MAG: hypothetical protein C9356_00700 [Oleiphilus sp.]|nr:MAG: hypothetical protein C9356_00700 [Oleiphilus sp.]
MLSSQTLRLFTLVLCSSWSLLFSSASAATGKSAYDESLVRAAIVFGILRFTSWPEKFAPSQEVNLCAYGASPAAKAIAGLESTPSIGMRKVVHREVTAISGLADCHAVIVGKDVSIQDLLPNAILMICDGCDSRTKDLSSITLARMDNRIQFEINLDRIDEQRLSLSSSLLELAAQCSSSNPAIKGCRNE